MCVCCVCCVCCVRYAAYSRTHTSVAFLLPSFFLRYCITLDPAKRPQSVEDIKQSKVYAGYDFQGLNAKTLVPPFTPAVDVANCEVNGDELESMVSGSGGGEMEEECNLTEAQQKTFMVRRTERRKGGAVGRGVWEERV